MDIGRIPEAFLPRRPYGLTDYENLYAADLEHDIFELLRIDRVSAVVGDCGRPPVISQDRKR